MTHPNHTYLLSYQKGFKLFEDVNKEYTDYPISERNCIRIIQESGLFNTASFLHQYLSRNIPMKFKNTTSDEEIIGLSIQNLEHLLTEFLCKKDSEDNQPTKQILIPVRIECTLSEDLSDLSNKKISWIPELDMDDCVILKLL